MRQLLMKSPVSRTDLETFMLVSQAHVETVHASRYLQQLCKHWSHKFPVTFDQRAGLVPFGPDSTVEFNADEAGLHMRLTVSDTEKQEQMQRVVADHLKRFAFREDLSITWTTEARS
jgi:uncharacterized protein